MSTAKFPNTLAKQSESMQQYGLSNTKNKMENLFTDFNHSKNCSSFLLAPCARCHEEQSLFQCVECRSIKLCSTCNNQLHESGKFLYHQRVPLIEVNQFQCSSLTQFTTPTKIKSGQIISHQLTVKKAKINISQTWNNIISQLTLKFQEIFNSLDNKKRQLVHKLQNKRDNEIYLYQQAVNGLQNGQQKQRKLKKNIIQRNQDFHLRIKAMEIESIQKKFNKEYKYVSSTFQDILNSVKKIQIKNFLFKVSDQIATHTIKKTMKGSLIVGNSNTSSALSPSAKALTYEKSPLSLSTIEGTEKSNNQQSSSKTIGFYYGKETKGLSQVRSQKLFCKSPTNSTKIIKQLTKNKKQL